MFRIKEHQLLGEGAFGQVYKATVCGLPNAGKQTVAIKKLKGNKRNNYLCASQAAGVVLFLCVSLLVFCL